MQGSGFYKNNSQGNPLQGKQIPFRGEYRSQSALFQKEGLLEGFHLLALRTFPAFFGGLP